MGLLNDPTPDLDDVERFGLLADPAPIPSTVRRLPPLQAGEELAETTAPIIEDILAEYTNRGRKVITMLWGLDGQGARTLEETAQAAKLRPNQAAEIIAEAERMLHKDKRLAPVG